MTVKNHLVKSIERRNKFTMGEYPFFYAAKFMFYTGVIERLRFSTQSNLTAVRFYIYTSHKVDLR